jgi:hypothetical protein
MHGIGGKNLLAALIVQLSASIKMCFNGEKPCCACSTSYGRCVEGDEDEFKGCGAHNYIITTTKNKTPQP